MSKKRILISLSSLALAAISTNSFASGFLPGDLAVVRVGTGSGTLSSAGTALFVDEYMTNGTLRQSIAAPTTGGTALTVSGSASSEGSLNASGNGSLFTCTGYRADAGTASVVGTGAATNPRVVGSLNWSTGAIDTSTSINNQFDKNNIRSAYTDNGSLFYTSGANSGVVSVANGGTTGTVVSATVPNERVIHGFGGGLYFSTASGTTKGIFSVDLGSGVSTNLINTGSSSSSYDFLLVDPTHMLVTDDTSGGAGGIFEYAFNGSAWVSHQLTATATRSIALLGNSLYFTSADGKSILSANYSIGSYGGETTIAAAAANTVFRGIKAVPEPGSYLVLGVGFIGLLARRRRK